MQSNAKVAGIRADVHGKHAGRSIKRKRNRKAHLFPYPGCHRHLAASGGLESACTAPSLSPEQCRGSHACTKLKPCRNPHIHPREAFFPVNSAGREKATTRAHDGKLLHHQSNKISLHGPGIRNTVLYQHGKQNKKYTNLICHLIDKKQDSTRHMDDAIFFPSTGPPTHEPNIRHIAVLPGTTCLFLHRKSLILTRIPSYQSDCAG